MYGVEIGSHPQPPLVDYPCSHLTACLKLAETALRDIISSPSGPPSISENHRTAVLQYSLASYLLARHLRYPSLNTTYFPSTEDFAIY